MRLDQSYKGRKRQETQRKTIIPFLHRMNVSRLGNTQQGPVQHIIRGFPLKACGNDILKYGFTSSGIIVVQSGYTKPCLSMHLSELKEFQADQDEPNH